MKTTQQYHLGNCFQNIFNKFYEVAEQLKEEESDTVAQVKRVSRARERDEKRVMIMMCGLKRSSGTFLLQGGHAK